MNIKSVALYLNVTLLIFTAVGCGGEEGLGRVTGVVKLDGQPLPNAFVEFNPLDGKGLTSYGRTESDGSYYMMATRSDKGAAVGKNKVKITTAEILDNGGKTSMVPEKVPTKYNQSSTLEVDVESGSNNFDFDLKSEGGKIINRKENP